MKPRLQNNLTLQLCWAGCFFFSFLEQTFSKVNFKIFNYEWNERNRLQTWTIRDDTFKSYRLKSNSYVGAIEVGKKF